MKCLIYIVILSISRLPNGMVLKNLYGLYPEYTLDDLISHPGREGYLVEVTHFSAIPMVYFSRMPLPGIVFKPYSVMCYKLTEFYSMGIPLFVPSPRYFRDNGGLGNDRTSTSKPYCDQVKHGWSTVSN